MSPGVYRRLTGNIFAFRGAVSRDGLNGNIPRPFVVVHSGKTTTGRLWCSRRSVWRSTRLACGGGVYCGAWKARKIAWKRDILWTRRVEGYEAVKTGSNIAARYRASMGEVHEDAMIDDGCGRCDLWWLARDLCGRVQHMRGLSGGPDDITLSLLRQSAGQSTTHRAPQV